MKGDEKKAMRWVATLRSLQFLSRQIERSAIPRLFRLNRVQQVLHLFSYYITRYNRAGE